MRARLLVNLVLLILVAVLAAVVYFEPGLAKAPATPTLTVLEAKDIATVRIERPDGGAVAFARRDGLWWMVEPVELPAGEYRIESLLDIAQAETTARYDAGEADLTALGLDPPGLRVTYDGKESIVFGAQSPFDQRRYVRVGDQVHLVNGTLYYHLVGHYTTFLDTSPLPAGARISALHLPDVDLVQRDGRWTAAPEPAGFSADAVNVLLEHWGHTRALQVSRYQADSRGGERNQVRVEFADGREPITFVVVAREPELVLARPELGVAYRFTAESAERLFTLRPLPEPSAPD